QVALDQGRHHAAVGALLGGRRLDALAHDAAGLTQKIRLRRATGKAAADELGLAVQPAGLLVDGDDREHDSALGQVTAVPHDDLVDLLERAVDEHAADLDLAGQPGLLACHLEDVPALSQEYALARHADLLGQ